MAGTWTFDASANVLTVAGGASSFIDAWNADQANGWNVVHKQGDNQFLFDCKLQIGDGSTATYFADANKQITFKNGILTSHDTALITTRANSVVTLGMLEDSATKRTSRGIDFIMQDSYRGQWRVGGTLNLYSCTFRSINERFVIGRGVSSSEKGTNIVYNFLADYYTTFDGLDSINNVFFNVLLEKGHNYGYGFYRTNGVFDRLTITDYGYLFGFAYTNAQNYTLRNVLGKSAVQATFYEHSITNSNIYLINADLDAWTFEFDGGSTGTVNYRQYEFDLTVTDKDNNPLSGASVTLKDKDGNTVFSETTDANGAIATQTVSRGFYDQAHGDTVQEYSPHTLTITKAGYQMYVKKFVLSEKTRWELKLARAQTVLLELSKPVVNLCGSDPENTHIMQL